MQNIFGFALLLSMFLGGCAASHTVRHAFGFDMIDENPQVEVIDWKYGQSKNYGAHPLSDQRATKRVNVMGEFLYPTSLYVKWRNTVTNSIHEESVDFKDILPKNLTDHRVHFSVKDDRLYVYLITPELRPPNWPIYPPLYSQIYKSYQIYPDKT